jgi:lipopolysaccharide export system protein LptC
MFSLNRLSRAFDRVSIYLPIILMGLLAMGTYWLLRSTPPAAGVEAAKPATHEADYFMRGFSLKTFDRQGRLQTELTGRELRHFPDTDTLEIDQVKLRAYNDEGLLTTATGDRALSNGDGSEVQFMGNAVVVQEASVGKDGRARPRLELRSDFLHAVVDTEQVRTHLPVIIRRGADEFSADSMDFDNLNRLMSLQGRVRGSLIPAPTP